MKFNFDDLLTKARKLAKRRGGDIAINLPFISFTVKAEDIEVKIARELMVRLPDKRVLSSKECCDGCIDSSLESIQEIRGILIDKQVELSHLHDGGLYLLIEYMAEGIRQFLTASERRTSGVIALPKTHRSPDARLQYFESLGQLRFHMHSCLLQVSRIAGMETPKVAQYLRSSAEWDQPLYITATKIDAWEQDTF